MSCQCVVYEIRPQEDGALAITVTATTGMTVTRRGLACHAEAQMALNYLRVILAAQKLHLVQGGGPALT